MKLCAGLYDEITFFFFILTSHFAFEVENENGCFSMTYS